MRDPGRPQVALVGHAGSGERSIFRAALSTSVRHERLAGAGPLYEECAVEIGLDQVSLVHLPSIESFHEPQGDTALVLKYLLWGDRWPAIARHEADQPTSAFAAPDVLVLVIDATALERDLELALEFTQSGKPMVIALNRMDEARARRRFINTRTLSARIGAPAIPTVAHMGIGLAVLFSTVVRAAREKQPPQGAGPSPHIVAQLSAIATIAEDPDVTESFHVPTPLLTLQLAENDGYFYQELRGHFLARFAELLAALVRWPLEIVGWLW